MTAVLVVDDVPSLAQQYAYDLKRVGGYEVLTAGSGAEALELLAGSAVDCVILDLEMPGMDGFAVLRALEERGSEVPVIVYTGTGNYDRCIQAVRLGAYGFIDKSEPMERVVREVETVLERKRLHEEVASLRRQLGESSLVGESSAIRRLRGAIARVAPIPSPVLILGRERIGEGAGRPGSSQPRAGRRRAVHCHQQRGASRESYRERIVRPRAWRFHRSSDGSKGRLRGGGARHAVPGRDRRAPASRRRPSSCECWRSVK